MLRPGLLGWFGFVDRKAMRRRSEDELDRLGVRTAPMTRPVEMLSGGQRQVVALARSAIRVYGESNGVLLLDEPTAALGYEQTKQVEALIRRMADQGIAIVLVTHNLPLCQAVADRVVILNRGRKVADVPAGRDRDRPRRRLDHRRTSRRSSRHEHSPGCRLAVPPVGGHRLAQEAMADPEKDRRFREFIEFPTDSAGPDVAIRDTELPGPHGPVPVRIYQPADGGGAQPALVWLHGGAFMFGDLDMPEADRTAREVCARAGAVVVSVDYRLAIGGVHYPVPLDDCVAAARWVRDHAAELGVDSARSPWGARVPGRISPPGRSCDFAMRMAGRRSR